MELRLVGPEGREWESHEHAFSDGVIEGAEREAQRQMALRAAETPREQVTILPDPRPRTPYLLVGLGALLGGLVVAVGFLAAPPAPAPVVQPIIVQVPAQQATIPESSWTPPERPAVSVTPAPEPDATAPADEDPVTGGSGSPANVPDVTVVELPTSQGGGGEVSQSTPPAPPAPAPSPAPAPVDPPVSQPGPVTPEAPEQPGLVGGLLGGVGGLVDDVVCVLVCV